MKTAGSQHLSRTLRSAAMWALGFFAVFGLAIYTYAISYPATQPNPVSGVVGLFVGATPAAYTGNQVAGYNKANQFCEAAHDYSHVCTAMEMINTYNHNPTALQGQAESLWVNSGAPGNKQQVTNDCRGWTSGSSTLFATVWNTSKQSSYLASCDLSRKFACCK